MSDNSETFSPIDISARRALDFRPGHTVRVWQKIKEGDKVRLQSFEGLVIARRHGAEPGATFTVRRIASGVGTEKTFPLFSPNIDRIELIRRAKVRRAKLFYIRDKTARDIRRRTRHAVMADLAPAVPDITPSPETEAVV
ncbi:MAG TPA: 50S ribosomal protein L19 [Candidatus Paceibacterota bacterium]